MHPLPSTTSHKKATPSCRVRNFFLDGSPKRSQRKNAMYSQPKIKQCAASSLPKVHKLSTRTTS
eukprot:9550510-Ditylum_brightwellii.AAC.1